MNNYIFTLNLKVFDNTEGLIYYLNAIDIKHQFLSAKFKILNKTSKTIELRSLIKITKIMLVELCARNYATYNSLINGVDGFFKIFMLVNYKPYIFIEFLNRRLDL